MRRDTHTTHTMELEKILQNTATDRYGERDTRYLGLVDDMERFRQSGDPLTGLRFVLDKIPQGSSILEFGPASGYMTRYLKEQLNCEVTIVELDPECAESASKYAADCFVGSAEDVGWSEWLGDRQFDAILFCDVLEHLRSPWDTLKWTTSHLKDDGSIFCSIPNVAHHTVIAHLLENEFEYFQYGLLDITHIRFFTARSIKDMLKYCDLKAVDQGNTSLALIDKNSPDPWFFRARTPWIAELQRSMLNLPQYTIFQYVVELKKNGSCFSQKEIDICEEECFDQKTPFTESLQIMVDKLGKKNTEILTLQKNLDERTTEISTLQEEKDALNSTRSELESQLQQSRESYMTLERQWHTLYDSKGRRIWNRLIRLSAVFLILPGWRRHFRNKYSLK